MQIYIWFQSLNHFFPKLGNLGAFPKEMPQCFRHGATKVAFVFFYSTNIKEFIYGKKALQDFILKASHFTFNCTLEI